MKGTSERHSTVVIIRGAGELRCAAVPRTSPDPPAGGESTVRPATAGTADRQWETSSSAVSAVHLQSRVTSSGVSFASQWIQV